MEEIIESGNAVITNSGSYVKLNDSNIYAGDQGYGVMGVGGSSGTSAIKSSTNIVYTYPSPPAESYVVFELPRRQIPRKVYLNGRLATLGRLGNDVQAAHDGTNKLVFKASELGFYTAKITVSIEYDDSMYHYNIEHNCGVVKFKPNSNVLDAVLVSEIEQ